MELTVGVDKCYLKIKSELLQLVNTGCNFEVEVHKVFSNYSTCMFYKYGMANINKVNTTHDKVTWSLGSRRPKQETEYHPIEAIINENKVCKNILKERFLRLIDTDKMKIADDFRHRFFDRIENDFFSNDKRNSRKCQQKFKLKNKLKDFNKIKDISTQLELKKRLTLVDRTIIGLSDSIISWIVLLLDLIYSGVSTSGVS